MQLEPPTLSLGVPTIWMGLIQAYDAALADAAGALEAAGRPALDGRRRGGARGADPRVRKARRHARPGLGHDRDLAAGDRVVSGVPNCKAPVDDEQFRRAAMAGCPVPLVDVRLRTDDGADAPRDGRTPGEIQVRGPFITGSYHEVPVTEDKFTADGWLRTGDVATMDELGFVRITDRTKDLIKSGGEWISSVDLENALMAHPAIAEAAVIAIPDAKWSERPLACVVFKPGQSASAEALGAHLLQHGFAKWQLPERVEVIDAIPAHRDRQVLEAQAARALPALSGRAPGYTISKMSIQEERHAGFEVG